MSILKYPRWERFAQLLAQPQPPLLSDAYSAVGFKRDRAHAARLAAHPLVAKRIAELQAATGRAMAAAAARAEALTITKLAVSRESLMVDTAAAFKVAENAGNAQGMVAAIKLMAELAQISLKAPEDKQTSQHLHIHDSLIDRPPTETLEQWIERKRLEADARATSKLKLVGKPD